MVDNTVRPKSQGNRWTRPKDIRCYGTESSNPKVIFAMNFDFDNLIWLKIDTLSRLRDNWLVEQKMQKLNQA